MRTPTRRAIVAASAVGLAAAASAAVVPTTDEALTRAAFLDWRAVADARALPDGSTLSVYAGQTPARDGRDAVLRVEFVPRFGCAPGVDLVLGRALAARVASAEAVADAADDAAPGGLVDDDEAGFLVDGAPVGFPVLVDEDGGRVALAFNGNERERMTLRLQLDVGDVASVELLGDAEPLSFSLLGSRSTLAAVESLCLTHEPVEPDAVGPDARSPDAG